MIIGNAAGGKSVFAEHLSKSRHLPHYRLDMLQWNPGWVPTSREEFNRRHNTLLIGNKWIIDGFASWESIELRFEAADTIILIDHSLWLHYFWALKRQFLCLFRPRPNFVESCPMLPMTWKLLKMIWQIHWELRPRLIELANSYRERKWVYHIHSPSELRELVKVHCSK